MADFCTRVASQAILNQIKNDCTKNLVLSPLALKCMLNMLGSGSTGQTLEQILSFVASKSLSDLNLDSLKMIHLVSMKGDEDLSFVVESKTNSDLKLDSLKMIDEEDEDLSLVVESKSLSEQEEDDDEDSYFISEPESLSDRNLYSWNMLDREEDKDLSFDSCHQGPVLSFVNGVWIDFRLHMNPSFERTAREVYRADAREVDFLLQGEQVREEVNSWAEKETRGLIKDLLSEGSCNDAMLLLANALYFKGTWSHPFESFRTRDKPFYRLDGSSVKVPFMTKIREFEFFGSFPGFKILKLPYKTSPPPDSRKFSMYFFLSDATDGLQGLIQELNSNPGLLRSALPKVELSIVSVPKFKFSYAFEASDTLQEMGLTLPFRVGAELKGMIDGSSALPYEHNVKKMIQKCFIEVNEQGTEAAACSFELSIGCRFNEAPLPCFVADHPFLFLIKEEVSESVVFSGAVLNP